MSTIIVQSRVNPEIKQKAEEIFASIGISMPEAIRIFLHQTVNRHGLPFDLEAKIPNSETRKAMWEAENGMTESFDSFADFIKSVEEEMKDEDNA